MELRAGYKNTEIGVIPEDWDVVDLESISKITMGQSPSSINYNELGIGLPLIQGNADIKNRETIIRNYTSQITKICRKNDIIMSVRAPVGEISRAKFDACIGRGVCAIRYFNNYLFQYLVFFEPKWSEYSTGSTFSSVNSDTIKGLKIPLPPLPEQTAIANVLSDTDNLLQTLEKKIAKKRLIKQGAMQELLKPKEDWVVKPLGKFVNFSNGKAHENHIDVNGDYTVVNSKFVSTGGRIFKSATANFSPLKKGDIVMVMSDIPNGKVLAKCFLVPKDDKYALNQRVCSIRTEEVDTKYLLYILNRNKYYLAFDGGTGQTNLKKKDVLNCPIPLPKTKEEQTKIATILSEMDTEIENLEKQLAKYKQVKQGLMQNLLTGKIRLV